MKGLGICCFKLSHHLWQLLVSCIISCTMDNTLRIRANANIYPLPARMFGHYKIKNRIFVIPNLPFMYAFYNLTC